MLRWWTFVFLCITANVSNLYVNKYPFNGSVTLRLFIDKNFDYTELFIQPDSEEDSEKELSQTGQYTSTEQTDLNQSEMRHDAVEVSVQHCPTKPCARKCCEFGKGYDVSKERCVELPDSLQLLNPQVWNGNSSHKVAKTIQILYFVQGNFTCKSDNVSNVSRIPVTNVSKEFRLLVDGNIHVEFPYTVRASPVSIYKTDEYCIDRFVSSEEKNRTNYSALICYNESMFSAQHDIINDSRTHDILCSSCMLVICFLIALRVLVFVWLPELRTFHGMILMAYLISFLVGYLLLGITELLITTKIITLYVCKFTTFIVYFALLAAFFWQNIICYDIWWTFSGKRAVSGRRSPRTQFYLYCMYAITPPAVMTILLFVFSEVLNDYKGMAKVKHQECFLYGYTKLIFFYGPMILLFVVNMIFFLLTTLKIIAAKKKIKTVMQNMESHKHLERDTQRFVLYAKLFSVMAFVEINWMFEVISVFYPDAITILDFSDAYNVVVALIMFINFLCQRNTWRMIKKRYRVMKGLPASEAYRRNTLSQTSYSQSQDDLQINITPL